MRTFWQKLTRIGVDDTVDPADVKYITLCNIFAFLAILILLIFIPIIDWLVDLKAGPVIFVNIMGIVLFSGVVLLNHLQHFFAARLLAHIDWLVILICNSLLIGHAGLLTLYLMGAVLFLFAASPPRERRLMFALETFYILVFFALEGWLYIHGPLLMFDNAFAWVSGFSARVGLFLMVTAFAYYNYLVIRQAEHELQLEHDRAEALLLNVLPAPIARKLKDSPGSIAERFDEATILFADIVNFTPLSQRLNAQELVALLDRIFRRFDELVEGRGLEKIKTIGDAYMVAGGIPVPRADHCQSVAELALEMVAIMEKEFRADHDLQLRIGIHSGPIVAGVIGRSKFIYDLWGDSVNTASRMESHGLPGKIQVTAEVRRLLADRFDFSPRGLVDVKGKGAMEVFLLEARSEPVATGAAP